MRHQHHPVPRRRAQMPRWTAALLLLAGGGLSPVLAQPPSLEPRVPVGKCVSPRGTLLQREAAGGAWLALAAGDEVHSRDRLLALPGIRAALEPKGDAVRLGLWGNLPELSNFPVRESAVVLHDSRAYDLDFTLERGRVVLTNCTKKGAVRVWVRLAGVAWELTLPAPGDEVALELAGRWPHGTSFEKTPRPGQRPTQVVALHVLKGSLTFKANRRQYRLAAPPGPAYLHWDSVTGLDEGGPQRGERVPAWAADKAEQKRLPAAVRAALKRLVDLAARETVADALTTFLAEVPQLADGLEVVARRRLTPAAMGAVDDLQGLTDALAGAKNAGLREAAVEALRHWIGRRSGQDLRLYRFLVQRQEFPEAQAETVLQLLHSPFEPDRPETYDTLIAYLRHSRLAVRELARWHLYRLVPAGRKIVYDAGASEAARQKAYEAWKKLIPSGKLPPTETPK